MVSIIATPTACLRSIPLCFPHVQAEVISADRTQLAPLSTAVGSRGLFVYHVMYICVYKMCGFRFTSLIVSP